MVDLTKRFSDTEADQEALNNFMNFLQGPKIGQAAPVEIPLRREEPEEDVPALNEALPQPTEQLPEVATPTMSNPVQQPKLETSKLTQVLQSLRGKLNPDLSIYDKMQKDLESARNQNLEDLKNARLQDSNANMYSGISAGINQISQGLANRAGYTDIKTNPFKYDANKSEQVGTDNKSKLDALMERYKLASDKERAKLDNEMRKANLDVEIAKAEDANTLRRELAKQKLEEDRKKKEVAAAKPTEAQKVIDREFGKDYSTWVGGGAERAKTEVKKLKDVINNIKAGNVSLGKTNFLVPDILADSERIKARADVESSVMSSLRPILGAQFTEEEGKRVIRNTWNENDTEENNVRRLEKLVNDLENDIRTKTDRAKFYEASGGSLKDYQPISNSENSISTSNISSSGPYGSTVERNGKMYQWDSSKGKYVPVQ